MARPCLLISAYACEPAKGSEQGVGWNWCLELATRYDLVIITRANNSSAIDDALPLSLRPHISLEYVDIPTGLIFKRGERGLYWYYLLWQLAAYDRARAVIKRRHVDYVLHLTFGSIWLPTFMHWLPRPFVWGPIGGGEAVPPALLPALPIAARFAQRVRQFLCATARFNPFLLHALARSSLIITRTADTFRLLSKKYQAKATVVLETAMSDSFIAATAPRLRSGHCGPVRAIYTGRLVALKNVSCLIEAFAVARARGSNIVLSIVGDGPQRGMLEALVERLNVSEVVSFTGKLDHAEVIEKLHESDVYVFPSLKEGGAWSLMEAMTIGLPVICLEASGMAIITDDTCALRLPPDSPSNLREAMTQAIMKLAANPSLRDQLGRNARARIERHFRWRHKVDALASASPLFVSSVGHGE